MDWHVYAKLAFVLFIIYISCVVVGDFKKVVSALNSEDIAIIQRANNLFECVPFRGGEEWEMLSTLDLSKIILDASLVIRNAGNSSKREILEDFVDRCENLSAWMLENKDRPFYKDSDMSYLVIKPKEVAQILREHYS